MSRVRDQLAELREEPAPLTFHPRPAARAARRRCRGAPRDPGRGALGAGSWGTTFAKVLADAGCDVMLHARRAGAGQAITENGENADYLPGIRLPAGGARDGRPGRGAARTRRSSSSPCPSQSLREQPRASGRRCCRRTRPCSR